MRPLVLLGLRLLAIIWTSESLAQEIDTLFPVKKHEKWGFINQKGELKIPFNYDAALNWGNSKFGKVKKGNEWFYVNKLGTEFSTNFIGTLKEFNDTLLIVKNIKGEFISDEFGKGIHDEIYQEIKPLTGEFYQFRKVELTGLASITKGVLVPPNFDFITLNKSSNYFITNVCGKYGLYSLAGVELLPAIYNFISLENDSLVRFGDGEANLKGLYSLKNQTIEIPPLYNEFLNWNENFVSLKEDSKLCLFVREGKLIEENRFNSIFIKDEFAYVLSDSGEGLISKFGDFILLPNNQELVIQNELILVKKNGYFKFYSKNGNLLLNEEFLDIKSLDTPNWLALRSDSSWILLDKKLTILQKDLWNPFVLNSIIKSEKEGEMIRIELDEKGAIKDISSYSNVVNFKVNGFRNLNTIAIKSEPNIKTSSSDSRWYFDLKLKKWGLKSTDGKMLVSPKFDYIIEKEQYNLTIVYKKCPVFIINHFSETYEICALAGLVDYNTGKIIIEPEHVDVVLRGPAQSPIFFTINSRLEFKIFSNNKKLIQPAYIWIEDAFTYPLRALLRGEIRECKYRDDYNNQSFSSALKEIVNPYVINRFKKYSSSNNFVPLNPVWVYINSKGEASKSSFSNAFSFQADDLAIVQDIYSKKMGLINRAIYYAVKPDYHSIKRIGDSYILIKNDTIQSIVNDNYQGEYFQEVSSFEPLKGENAYFSFYGGKGFWTKNSGAKFLNEITKILPFSNGLAAVKNNGKWGFIDDQGEIVIPCEFSKIISFNDQIAAVKQKNTWKTIKMNGEVIDTLPWKDIKDWNNLIWASDGNVWKMLDNNFKIIEYLPPFKSFTKDRKTSNLIAFSGISSFLINQNNEVVYQGKLSKINSIDNENYTVKKNFKSYLYNKNTGYKKLKRNILPIQVNNNRMWIKKNGLYYFADTTGELVSKVGYERYFIYSNGIAAGRIEKEWKVFDTNGDIIFSTEKKPLHTGSANFMLFKDINGFYTFYDKSGIRLNMPSFNDCKVMKNGNIWVSNLGKWGLLDATLEWIKYPQFDRIISINDVLTAGVYHQIQGLCNLKGEELIPAYYPFIKKESNGYYRAEAGNEVHWYKPNGVCIYGNIEKNGKSTAINLPKTD